MAKKDWKRKTRPSKKISEKVFAIVERESGPTLIAGFINTINPTIEGGRGIDDGNGVRWYYSICDASGDSIASMVNEKNIFYDREDAIDELLDYLEMEEAKALVLSGENPLES